MIGAILYRQIWNKLNLTRKLQDFQQAGKTRHDLAEAIFYMTVARSLMPDSGLAQWNKHNTFVFTVEPAFSSAITSAPSTSCCLISRSFWPT